MPPYAAPLATALAAVLTLGAGVVAAVDLRGDAARERERQLAAELAAQADQRWTEDLRGLVEQTYDVSQPLLDAFDQFGGDPALDDLYPSVRDDVLAGSGAPEQLRRLRDELRDLTVPAGREDDAEQLVEGLTALADAGQALDEGTRARVDEDGNLRALADGQDELSRARSLWSAAVSQVFTQDAPQVPRPGRVPGGQDREPPRSLGRYLLEVGTVCAEAVVGYGELGFLEDATSDEEALGLLVAYAAFEIDVVDRLRRVTLPRGVSESARESLADYEAYFLAQAEAGLGDGDVLSRLDGVFDVQDSQAADAIGRAGLAYEQLGSITCAEWLDPLGDLGLPEDAPVDPGVDALPT